MRVKYECPYCGHRQEHFLYTLDQEENCTGCNHTLTMKNVLNEKDFDVFGYNHKPKTETVTKYDVYGYEKTWEKKKK